MSDLACAMSPEPTAPNLFRTTAFPSASRGEEPVMPTRLPAQTPPRFPPLRLSDACLAVLHRARARQASEKPLTRAVDEFDGPRTASPGGFCRSRFARHLMPVRQKRSSAPSSYDIRHCAYFSAAAWLSLTTSNPTPARWRSATARRFPQLGRSASLLRLWLLLLQLAGHSVWRRSVPVTAKSTSRARKA